MQNYQTQATLRLPSGVVVGLTPEQAASRQHVLTQQAVGVYVASTPLQFKAGEVIGLDAVPAGLSGQLLLIEPEAGDTQSLAPLPAPESSTKKKPK